MRCDLTNEIILAPSVRDPAPSVMIRSAPFSLISFATSRISVHGVCGLMPYLMATILFLNSESRETKFPVLLIELETIRYTLEAWKVLITW